MNQRTKTLPCSIAESQNISALMERANMAVGEALNSLDGSQLEMVVLALGNTAAWAYGLGKNSNTVVLNDIGQEGWYD